VAPPKLGQTVRKGINVFCSSVPLIRAQEQTRVHDRPRLGEWRRHDLPQPVARRRRGGQLGGPRVGAREGEREEGACRRGRAAPLNIFQAQEQTRVHEAPRTRSGVYRSAAGWSGVCPLTPGGRFLKNRRGCTRRLGLVRVCIVRLLRVVWGVPSDAGRGRFLIRPLNSGGVLALVFFSR